MFCLPKTAWPPTLQVEAAPQHRVTKPIVSGTAWKGRRYRVIAPYAKATRTLSGVPKYVGAKSDRSHVVL